MKVFCYLCIFKLPSVDQSIEEKKKMKNNTSTEDIQRYALVKDENTIHYFLNFTKYKKKLQGRYHLKYYSIHSLNFHKLTGFQTYESVPLAEHSSALGQSICSHLHSYKAIILLLPKGVHMKDAIYFL